MEGLLTLPKIAIFLFFFALIALLFEIFYFRKKRKTQVAPLAEGAPPKAKMAISFWRRTFVIVGLILIVVVLPISVYVVFQRVSLQKEAQVGEGGTLTIGCDQIDITKDTTVVLPSTLAVGDTVSFIGYCYLESTSQALLGQNTITQLRFLLTSPAGKQPAVDYVAFNEPQKSTQTRKYFKATYPNVPISQAGSYTLDLWGYSIQTNLSPRPYTKQFSVIPQGGIGGITIPTQTPTPAQTDGSLPVCRSLSAIPLTGPAPLTVSLTGSGSDNTQVVGFEFTFGDGAIQTVNRNVGQSGSASIAHAYQQAGSYSATLAVKDNNGQTSDPSALCQVSISVTSQTSSLATSSALKAQPTKTVIATPMPVALPQAGISLPTVGFVSLGLFLVTVGLLLTF